jgi:hypothetical protein
MPAFVDESLAHPARQGRLALFDLGESLTPGKLLYYYWIGLFGLNGPKVCGWRDCDGAGGAAGRGADLGNGAGAV